MRIGLLLVLLLLACCGNERFASPFETDALPAAPGGAPRVTLLCAGDTTAHDQERTYLDPDPLADVAGLLASGDVFVVNHECALAPPGTACPGWPWNPPVVAPPWTVRWFVRAPYNVATLANNHVQDCGRDGLARTLAWLDAQGVLTVGAGPDLADACAPRSLEVRGLPVTFLSYHAYDLEGADGDVYRAGTATPGTAFWDDCDGADDVARLRAAGHLVVVSLHMHLGPSYTATTWPRHRALVDAALDAGADLVLGHGAHVVQGLVARDGRLGFLGLGNLLFDSGVAAPPETRRSIVAQVAIHDEALVVTLHPVRLDEIGRPHHARDAYGRRILDGIARASVEGGVDVWIHGGRGHVVVPRRP